MRTTALALACILSASAFGQCLPLKSHPAPLEANTTRTIEGTCTAISSSEVLTCLHNLTDSARAEALVSDIQVQVSGTWHAATVLRYDKAHDLALLKVEGVTLTPVGLLDEAFAIGQPGQADMKTERGGVREILVSTDKLQVGMSGGAILLHGKLAGIITSFRLKDGKPVAFVAVGAEVVREFINGKPK